MSGPTSFRAARPRVVRVSAATAAAVVLLALSTAPAWAAGFTIADTRLDKPSGMAADIERQRYWVVTDDPGRLTAYAVDGAGTALGRFQSFDEVRAVEGIAVRGRAVYFGDVGGRRSTVSVLRAYGPVPDTTVRQALSYKLTYPDGPHDSEAIAVGADERIVVVTKAASKAGIYRAPANPSDTAASRLERIADAPANVTDATYLADGRLALRSATTAWVLDASFKVMATQPITGQANGAALAQRLDGQALLAGGLQVVDLPLKAAGNEPLPTPTPTPTPSAAPVQEVSATQQAGTTMGVLAASVVAVLAALVVLLKP